MIEKSDRYYYNFRSSLHKKQIQQIFVKSIFTEPNNCWVQYKNVYTLHILHFQYSILLLHIS